MYQKNQASVSENTINLDLKKQTVSLEESMKERLQKLDVGLGKL